MASFDPDDGSDYRVPVDTYGNIGKGCAPVAKVLAAIMGAVLIVGAIGVAGYWSDVSRGAAVRRGWEMGK